MPPNTKTNSSKPRKIFEVNYKIKNTLDRSSIWLWHIRRWTWNHS